MVVSLLLWRRWGVSGMSNLVVGVHRGSGVGHLGVREGPLTSGAHPMWSRPLLKPLREEESNCYTARQSVPVMGHGHNILPSLYLMMILMFI